MTKQTIENGQVVTHVIVAGGIVFHVLGTKESIVEKVNKSIYTTFESNFFVQLEVVEDSGEINMMHVNPNSIDFVADEHPWEVAQGHDVTL